MPRNIYRSVGIGINIRLVISIGIGIGMMIYIIIGVGFWHFLVRAIVGSLLYYSLCQLLE